MLEGTSRRRARVLAGNLRQKRENVFGGTKISPFFWERSRETPLFLGVGKRFILNIFGCVAEKMNNVSRPFEEDSTTALSRGDESPMEGHNRDLLQKYGITHHHHIKDVAFLSYSLTELEPRAVANAMLQRLHFGAEGLRLKDLRAAFLRCCARSSKERSECDLIPRADVDGFVDGLFEFFSSLPANSCPLDEAPVPDIAIERKPAAADDPLERLFERWREGLKGDASCGGPRSDALMEKVESFLRKRKAEQLDAIEGEGNNEEDAEGGSHNLEQDASMLPTVPSQTHSGNAQSLKPFAGGLSPSSPDHMDEADFFCLDENEQKRGFSSVFSAVDCQCRRRICWDDLLVYLMDVSLLGRVAAREAEIKDFELMSTCSSTTLAHLATVVNVPGREQYLVCARDAQLVTLNNSTYAVKAEIKTPSLEHSTEAAFKILCATYMEEAHIVVLSCTDSVIRFFSIYGGRAKDSVEYKMDCNQTALLFHEGKSMLFTGSRCGELTSFLVVHRPSEGIHLERNKTTQPHTDTISAIVRVSSEE